MDTYELEIRVNQKHREMKFCTGNNPPLDNMILRNIIGFRGIRDHRYAVRRTGENQFLLTAQREELLACIDRKLGDLFDTLYLGTAREKAKVSP